MLKRFPIVMMCALLTGAAMGAERVFDFGTAKLGAAPEGFRSLLTGLGKPGEWTVLMDALPSALEPLSPKALSTSRRPVLAQVSRDPTAERYPMLVFQGETYTDFTLTTQLKIVEGRHEQMAGLAFRIQDERNYYYVRANAKDKNLYFFKWVDGQRIGPIGSMLNVPLGGWIELAIQCKGNEIQCRLNGTNAFPSLRDNSFTSGKVGFWTAEDTVAYFADTRVVYTPKENLAQTLVRDALRKYPRLLGLRIYASTNKQSAPFLLASHTGKDLGQPAPPAEREIIARNGGIYHGKGGGTVTVSLPLRDRNGDAVAAVQVVMKSFTGQTENNAIARATPVVKLMQDRVQTAADLVQ